MLKMMKMLLIRWSNIRGEDEEENAKANFIEILQKQADVEIFPKE